MKKKNARTFDAVITGVQGTVDNIDERIDNAIANNPVF